LNEAAPSILIDSGIIYSGINTTYNYGISDLAAPGLLKMDSNGNVIDAHIYRTPAANVTLGALGALTKISNGFLLTGLYQDSLVNEILLIKISMQGDTIWKHNYGGTGFQAGWQVKETSDGNYVLCGQKRNGNSPEMLLMKLDTSGNIIWEQLYGNSINGELAISFTTTADSGYAMVGISSSPGPDFNIYVVKADSLGTMQWDTIIGSQRDEEGRCIISTVDGNILIAGFLAAGIGFEYAYMAKLDLQGNLLWQKTYIGILDFYLEFILLKSCRMEL
jgi:hypothetical protein